MSQTLPRSESLHGPVSPDAVDALLDRVAKSSEFANSPRSQEVLRFLCRRALSRPEEKISEFEIGVSVFGWRPDQDPGNDTIVRVQISQLRRKLDHYFAADGQDEPIAVRIPRGSYSPIFEPRSAPNVVTLPAPAPLVPEPLPPAPVVRKHWPMLGLLVATVAVVATIAGSVLWVRGQSAEGGGAPALDQFWKPFRSRPVQVVTSDGNLVLLTEILGRDVTLNEYRSQFDPARLAGAALSDPRFRAIAGRVLITHMTSAQDADVLGSLTTLLSRYRVPVTSISAQDFRVPQPDNLIVLGHSRVNPWLHLFEDRLNFRYRFDWESHSGTIVNRSPAAGERPVYTADFGHSGYCVVACVPKPIGEGAALLIYGSDLSSLQAGGRFVTDEHALSQLYTRLRVAPKNGPSYFEVLLKAKLLDNVAPSFDIEAFRVLSNDPPQR